MMLFEEMTTFDVREKINENSIAILPIGAIEEHGPHLPLNTDCLQPEYIAEEVATRLAAFVLPTLKYGVCSSTKNFPGTITLEFETLTSIIKDIICELARTGFKNVVILSGHAGGLHMSALKLAGQRALEKHDLNLMILSDYDLAVRGHDLEIPANDGHAGMIETSRVMAIRPDLVKGSADAFFPDFPEFRLLKDPEKYFPSGVMGDPKKASKENGEIINNAIIDNLTTLIRKMVTEEK